MIIDTHGHLVPPDLLAAIRKERARFPSLRLIEDGASLALAFAGGKPSRPIMKGLSDVAGRLAWMGKQGIDRQVIGSWPDWFGYELPAAEGEAWCLMISTLPRGIGSVLDAADLDPFWTAADETGAVIHIHPSYDAGDSRVNDFGLANGVGRVTDAIVAVARLLCSGHVTRYRNAKVFVPIGAAGLPFVIGRLNRNFKITPGIGDPTAGLGLLYTDSIVHDPRVLRFVVEMIGADRVMMGSDMPFPIGEEEPTKIVAAAGLKPDQVASINGGLAQKLFRIG